MAWNLLLTSDIGLLSLFTILFMVVMAAYIYVYVVKHMKDKPQERAAPVDASHAH